jgi:hypothetical protein
MNNDGGISHSNAPMQANAGSRVAFTRAENKLIDEPGQRTCPLRALNLMSMPSFGPSGLQSKWGAQGKPEIHRGLRADVGGMAGTVLFQVEAFSRTRPGCVQRSWHGRAPRPRAAKCLAETRSDDTA